MRNHQERLQKTTLFFDSLGNQKQHGGESTLFGFSITSSENFTSATESISTESLPTAATHTDSHLTSTPISEAQTQA